MERIKKIIKEQCFEWYARGANRNHGLNNIDDLKKEFEEWWKQENESL